MRLIEEDAFVDALKGYNELYDIHDIETALEKFVPTVDAVEINRVLESISFSVAYCTRGMTSIEEAVYLSVIEDFVTVLRQEIMSLKEEKEDCDNGELETEIDIP